MAEFQDEPRKRRSFKEWLFGDAEQLAHEKKVWGRMGGAALLGLALLWVRYHH